MLMVYVLSDLVKQVHRHAKADLKWTLEDAAVHAEKLASVASRVLAVNGEAQNPLRRANDTPATYSPSSMGNHDSWDDFCGSLYREDFDISAVLAETQLAVCFRGLEGCLEAAG